jgi:hypothetical protein
MAESIEKQDPRTPGNTRTAGRSGKKVNGLRPSPSERSLHRLNSLVDRSRRRTGLPLPEAFVRRADPDQPPPLAQFLRGGQGGEVRLKLYLCMSLLAVEDPNEIKHIPARSWAETLDLHDPDRNGARRVNDAIDWLHQHGFLAAERGRGTPGIVRLLSPTGTGEKYARPAPNARYVRLPLGVWQEGWIVRLSGSALALLIILLDMQGGRSGPQSIAPSRARELYDLSADTWTKGTHELREFGLLEISREPQSDVWEPRRICNTYWVNEETIEGPIPEDSGPRGLRRRRRVHARAKRI